MFRDILNHEQITDSVGNKVEIPTESRFGFRKRLDTCLAKLSAQSCGGIKDSCYVEVEREDRGIITRDTLKICDLRVEGRRISIPQA